MLVAEGHKVSSQTPLVARGQTGRLAFDFLKVHDGSLVDLWF
jgi:hypothetical protein